MKKIFLSGGMTGIDITDAVEWRVWFQDALDGIADVFNPVFHCPVEDEQRRYQLYKLKTSDIVIVNFNSPSSIGTAQELAFAELLGIPVIGLNAEHHTLHPWLLKSCWKILDSKEDVLDYLKTFYL